MKTKADPYIVPACKAAQAIGVTPKTLANWVAAGKLSAKRVGAVKNPRYFFRAVDVERLAEGEIVNPEMATA